MKDGKPEVLIIGEVEHPTRQYKEIREARKIEERENLLKRIGEVEERIKSEISKINKFHAQRILFEEVNHEDVEKICIDYLKPNTLNKFVNKLTEFGGRREKEFAAKTREALAQVGLPAEFIELCQKEETGGWHAKVIARIASSTGIFDIKFFDDYETMINEFAYSSVFAIFAGGTIRLPSTNRLKQKFEELHRTQSKAFSKMSSEAWKIYEDAEKKRDAAMLRNVKQLIIDKTAIICGTEHAKDFAEYFRKSSTAHVEFVFI